MKLQHHIYIIATMNINPSWGVGEDTRNNGAAFDGNIDSTTEFGDFPQAKDNILFMI